MCAKRVSRRSARKGFMTAQGAAIDPDQKSLQQVTGALHPESQVGHMSCEKEVH